MEGRCLQRLCLCGVHVRRGNAVRTGVATGRQRPCLRGYSWETGAVGEVTGRESTAATDAIACCARERVVATTGLGSPDVVVMSEEADRECGQKGPLSCVGGSAAAVMAAKPLKER